MSAEYVAGVLNFPGIVDPIRAVATRSLSTVPSTAVIFAQPQDGSPDTSGTATFRYGTTTNAMTWTNALADSGTLHISKNGRVFIVIIQDKRWRWRKGTPVTGAYNVRNPDGTIVTATQKTLAQLATILFTAMGEASADVSGISSSEYPEIVWDRDNPADELDALLLPRGYVVSLLLDDTAKVYQRGTGTPLPNNDDVINANLSLDPPEVPSILQLIANYTLVQSMLKCAAVGLDLDGKIKLIKDLSYNPGGVGNASGWDNLDLTTMAFITDPATRNLALTTVGRWFQAQSQADGTQNISFGSVDYVPGEITVDDVSQLFPLQPFILETETDVFGKMRYQDAFVSGTFWLEAVDDAIQVPGNTPDFTRVDKNTWRWISREYGIISFDQKNPAIKDDSGVKKMADVYLTCAYAINPPGTQQVKDRWTRERSLGGYGYDTVPIDDLQRQITVAYTEGTSTVSGITDSKPTAAADAVLDDAQAKYVTQASNVIFYRDTYSFNTDGITVQVRWDVAQGNHAPFATICSQYAEMLQLLPTQDNRDRAREIRRGGSRTNQRNKRYKTQMFGKTAPGGTY